MLPKAALLYELYERERSLARQRSELAAGERAAPKSNTELFVVAAESLRVQAASKASARLEGFGGERLDEARARAAQGKIAGRSNVRPTPRYFPSLARAHPSLVCVCLPAQFIWSRAAARSSRRSATSSPSACGGRRSL